MRMRDVSKIPLFLSLPLALAILVRSISTEAHAFGQFIALPIPLHLYYLGAGAAVLVSFIVIAIFVRGGNIDLGAKHINAQSLIIINKYVAYALRLAATFFLILVILAGFLGPQNAIENIAPLTLWVIFWVGFVYVCILLGNVFNVINPWKAIFEAIYKGRHPTPLISYPTKLGVWPATMLLLLFVWSELVYPHPEDPVVVSMGITIYTILAIMGMRIFGLWSWLRYIDFPSLYFWYLSMLSPIATKVINRKYCATCEYGCALWEECVGCPKCSSTAGERDKVIVLRIPGSGLVTSRATMDISTVAFITLVLSSISFDGLSRTVVYLEMLGYSPFPPPPREAIIVQQTYAMLGVYTLFLIIYVAIMMLSHLMANRRLKYSELIYKFILSLIPIAVVYNIAHYVDFVWLNSQFFIKSISDPLGYGWNIFGTAGMPISTSIDMLALWHFQVAIIVLGHILSVYIAHIIAIKEFKSIQIAVRSQYPVVTLMVGYTVFGLWLLSAPRGI